MVLVIVVVLSMFVMVVVVSMFWLLSLSFISSGGGLSERVTCLLVCLLDL